MAPFRRGRSSAAGPVGPDDEEEDGGDTSNLMMDKTKNTFQSSSAWDARRHRKTKGSDNSSNNNNNKIGFANTSRRTSKKTLPKGEYDPYDSDPGESYRDHCERIKGERTKSCLTIPRFLLEGGNPVNFLNNKGAAVANVAHHYSSRDVSTTATSPPSPLMSEQDDGSPQHHHHQHHPFTTTTNTTTNINSSNGPGSEQYLAHFYPQGMPASLPRDLARVRYSLRTSIGDGSDPQPAMASSQLMERRELRPNNVHINVSHWSDFGGRNYMEDRYVQVCIYTYLHISYIVQIRWFTRGH
jgi:hypothetical protein